ncbi:MAG TPA: hypothetical protein VMB21_17885 [Candidatus Limnocylindria bacterium]|nr:hypothetical protein [Candidatus Limnocylindria bacterium]
MTLLGGAILVFAWRALQDAHRQLVWRSEMRLADSLERRLRLFEIESQGKLPTNWNEFWPFLDTNRLYHLEEQIHRIRDDADFQHSVLEKYVFVNGAISSPHNGEAAVVLMTVQPKALNRRGHLSRIIISQAGAEVGVNTVEESAVQAAFAKAGRSIPTGTVLPPTVSKAWNDAQLRDEQRMRESMKSGLAEFLGSEQGRRLIPWYKRWPALIAGAVVVCGLALGVLWTWRSWRKPRSVDG